MVEEVERALQLQETDRRIVALQTEIAALPKHIAEIERQLDAHRKKLEADRAALAANQRERKQRDLDIGTQQQKISKLRDQMLQAKTNEQYRAFQHEIEFCENEIRKAEDRILELMAEAEPLDANVKAAEAALTTETTQVEKEKSEARERTAVDKAALEEAAKKRAALFASLPVLLQRKVDQLKKKHANGILVADATTGVCSGCRLQFRPQFFQDLKKSAETMFCENCGRILRYDPPIDVQAQYEGGTRVALS